MRQVSINPVDPFDTTTQQADDTFAQLMKEFQMPSAPKRNQFVTGTVVAETREGFGISLGLKGDSICKHDQQEGLKVGDTAQFVVVSDADENGAVELSHIRAARWIKAQATVESGETVMAEVLAVARPKGNVVGLSVGVLGLKGFNPRSELALRGSADDLVGKFIPVKVIAADPNKGKYGEFILSNVKAVEEEQRTFIASLTVGQRIEGTVAKHIDAGALIELGPITALCHRSEVTYDRSAKAADVVKKGETRTFEVIAIDPANLKVSLSLKRVGQDEFFATIAKGQVHVGTVAHCIPNDEDPYGWFIRLGGCVDGFLHVSELKGKRGEKEKLTKGQSLEVIVLDVNPEKKRISVSRKQLPQPKQQ